MVRRLCGQHPHLRTMPGRAYGNTGSRGQSSGYHQPQLCRAHGASGKRSISRQPGGGCCQRHNRTHYPAPGSGGLDYMVVAQCSAPSHCCENDCALSSRGTKCRGDLVDIPAGTVRDCFAALAMTQKVTFHSSWSALPVIIAVKMDFAMMKRLLMCHREERSDVAIPFLQSASLF